MHSNETRANRFFERGNYLPVSENPAPIIVAVNLKTPENAGHLIRLAGNLGGKKVVLVEPRETFRLSKIKRVAGAALNHVELVYCETDEIKEHIPPGFTLTALETAPGSTNIFTNALPVKMALVAGGEQDGLPQRVLEKCPMKVHIPMPGPVKSMNVSHAVAVALGEWLRQNLIR